MIKKKLLGYLCHLNQFSTFITILNYSASFENVRAWVAERFFNSTKKLSGKELRFMQRGSWTTEFRAVIPS